MPELSLQTHKFDKLTNRVSEANPYRLRVINGVKYFEHPVNSGNLYYENLKEHAGRFVSGELKKGAAHVAYEPPVSAGQDTLNKLQELAAQNEILKKELDAVAREREAKELSAKAQKETKDVTRERNARTEN